MNDALKTGDKVTVDFGAAYSDDFVTVNGQPWNHRAFPLQAVSLSLDCRNGRTLPVISMSGVILPTKGAKAESRQWKSAGYFVGQAEWEAFEAWRAGQESNR